MTTTMKTVIGLPLLTAVALGIAFGASALSRSLRQDPTLDANSDIQTETDETATEDASAYDAAVADIAASIYQRLTQSSAITNSPASHTSATNAAKIVLAGVCWLSTTPDDLSLFPTGAVANDFSVLINRYGPPAPVCTTVSSAVQDQASRLMILDDDGDGLNTIAEYWYTTNQFSPDTDRDGFPDNEEIQNGYTPLSAGTNNEILP